MKKIFKIIITIIYFIIAIDFFISFLDAIMHPDSMGINFICSLPLFPFSIALLVYAIKSVINIVQNKIKITLVDKIISIYLIVTIIFAVIYYCI